MRRDDSPYVFGDESPERVKFDPEERDVVISGSRAMSYRWHRRR